MAYRTLADVGTDVRFRTGMDSTSFTDTNLIWTANKYFRIILRHLIGLKEDFYAEISTASLVTNQQEYSLPAEASATPWGGGAVKILRIEVAYDDPTNDNNWRVADPLVWSQIAGPTNNVSNIADQFDTAAPKYAIYDKSLFLFPVPEAASTDGIRMFYIKRPGEMTATSNVPELTVDFLDTMGIGISIDIYESLQRREDMADSIARFNGRLAEMKQQEQGLAEEMPLRLGSAQSSVDYT